MSIKRVVDTSFWGDEKVNEEFSRDDKLFMLYLMTNPHSTQLGVYKILYGQITLDTGFSNDEISELMNRFENDYKNIRYSKETREIAIKNYLCYSIVKGGAPVYDLLVKESKAVKDKSLLLFVVEGASKSDNKTVKQFCNYIINQYDKDNVNQNVNVNDNDVNENENENEDSYHESYNESSTNRTTNRKEIPIYSDYGRRADS